MRRINGIPREAVAFSAGIHSVTDRSWEEIAEALVMLGFGRYQPSDLEVATGEWGIDCVERLVRLRAVARQVAAGVQVMALDRGRVVRRGGGFKS